ncbi:carboxymuconolactone decarboxylase family protein [Microbacterium sp. P07]|uniref:carboxymuconolactone decarboxylase family protein n=1 Tax=Microbacterium sp. P07 TaxID=3366952 RepID=UPI003745AC49
MTRRSAHPAYLASAALAAALVLSGCTATQQPESNSTPSGSVEADLSAVSPALAAYDAEVVQALWQREELSARDRSLVTVAQLVASGQETDLDRYVERALEDGVRPAELSEAVTHLAFYSGWQNAMTAVPVLAAVYDRRGVSADELPELDPELLPLDETAEAARADQVESDFGATAPGVVANTTDVLFQDLWLRPDLAPRDRSLITVVALISSGQVQQIPFHLNRAVDNGLTEQEVAETLNHLAFFAGWPRIFSAMPVVRDTLDARN